MNRIFYAYFLKDDKETGLGIVEKDGTETIAFQSIYIDERLSNRECIIRILDIIYNSLDTNKTAKVGLNSFTKPRGHHIPFSDKIYTYYAGFKKDNMQEVFDLVNDALQRKTTIKETL